MYWDFVESSQVSALVEVVEGDARYVLCEAVEKHQADILVVGSHGYGAIKRSGTFSIAISFALFQLDQ